jgi:cation diffusion facilitator CzcD-associated flavoprotein CzcO
VNQWKWPDIPGLHDFKGKLVHSAGYDPTYPITGKRVALIGAGSSGIQILPSIQPIVKRVDHYMRSRTWIAPVGVGFEILAEQGGTGKYLPIANPAMCWFVTELVYSTQ